MFYYEEDFQVESVNSNIVWFPVWFCSGKIMVLILQMDFITVAGILFSVLVVATATHSEK